MNEQAARKRIHDWFASKGWTSFAYQEHAWDAYLRGESGLVHSATGTGKSYSAWMGPIIEALEEDEQMQAPPTAVSGSGKGRKGKRANAPALKILWITPLRALANDLVENLREPIEGLGLDWTVEARTGDTSASLRAKQRAQLPTALVTTPESLSVMLSFPEARERLANLQCVVVDEWHELLGSKRGVQVELALARLRAWNPALRTWGLSATLANLQEAADVLCGNAGAVPVIINGDLPKEYRVDTIIPEEIQRFPWAGHLGLKLLPEVIEAIAAARSTLLFCNVRSQAEAWYQALIDAKPEWQEVLALHHGSIDRKLREHVEDALRAGELRCVVCTSSLDLGVDFSPVDQVIQVGSPKGVARLLQRAGRSGHQPGATSRVLGTPTHAFELVEFAAARQAMLDRAVEARNPLDRPIDVLVQHIVTVALGGGFIESELRDEVRTTHAFAELSDEEWGWALDFVTRGGPALRGYAQFNRVVQHDGRFTVDSAQIARFHRLAIGTITGDPVLELRFLRGKRLGTIEESFISRLRPGEKFVFAGKVLQLSRIKDMTAYVRIASGGKAQFPRWYGGKLSFSTQLGDAVRAKLDEARRGIWDDSEMRAIRPLLDLQQRWSRLAAPDEILVERMTSRDGHHVFVYPFEGRLVHEGLAALFAYRLSREESRSITTTRNDYGFELVSVQPLHFDEEAWQRVTAPEMLLEDLLASLNAAELDKRQFREIARVAGLVFPGYPGVPKSARQLQASSSLFYDVFLRYDPNNLLLDQARREVLERQLEIRRVREALQRLREKRVLLVEPGRLTPLAFPLWSDRMQASHLSSETWTDRVRRMAEQLEKAADAPSPKQKRRPARNTARTDA